MKVRVIIGAQAAYACINTGSTSLDIRLEAGRSSVQALREFAIEQQEKAARAVRYAALAREAAFILEEQKAAA